MLVVVCLLLSTLATGIAPLAYAADIHGREEVHHTYSGTCNPGNPRASYTRMTFHLGGDSAIIDEEL